MVGRRTAMTDIAVLGEERPDPTVFGQKALGLWTLVRAGASVPPTMMIPGGFSIPNLDLNYVTRCLGWEIQSTSFGLRPHSKTWLRGRWPACSCPCPLTSPDSLEASSEFGIRPLIQC